MTRSVYIVTPRDTRLCAFMHSRSRAAAAGLSRDVSRGIPVPRFESLRLHRNEFMQINTRACCRHGPCGGHVAHVGRESRRTAPTRGRRCVRAYFISRDERNAPHASRDDLHGEHVAIPARLILGVYAGKMCGRVNFSRGHERARKFPWKLPGISFKLTGKLQRNPDDVNRNLGSVSYFTRDLLHPSTLFFPV